MGAPKWDGMLFRGRPSGGTETRRAADGTLARLVGNVEPSDEAESRPPQGAACFLPRCLREHAGHKEISLSASAVCSVSADLQGRLRAGGTLHNGSIMNSKGRQPFY